MKEDPPKTNNDRECSRPLRSAEARSFSKVPARASTQPQQLDEESKPEQGDGAIDRRYSAVGPRLSLFFCAANRHLIYRNLKFVGRAKRPVEPSVLRPFTLGNLFKGKRGI